nr:baseplate assembly protein [Saccharospirillaceae bacterium]
MSNKFTAVDLSQLPPPAVVEELDYETIFADLLDSLQELDPDYTGLLESDPSFKLLQVSAYRELVLRQRINEAARAVMLAYAKGPDLEQIAARYNVERQMTEPGDPDATPPVPPTYESDEELLRRTQAAMHGFSIAGPERAYIYHALSADGRALDVAADAPEFSIAEVGSEIQSQLPAGSIVLTVDYDAGLSDPIPGDIAIYVLSREGNGYADSDLIESVDSHLNSEDIRPLSDHVIVKSAEVLEYEIIAEVFTYSGAGAEVALEESERRANAFVEEAKKLGQDIYITAITAALHAPGVEHVNLVSPAADLLMARRQAGHCTGITITSAEVANG